MKARILLISVALAGLFGCASSEQNAARPLAAEPAPVRAPLYTAYNIWLLPKSQRHNFKVINYRLKNVPILPAGTPVSDVKVSQGEVGASGSEPRIHFTTPDGKRRSVIFTKRYHPGKTVNDYEGLMFSQASFDQRVAEFSEEDVKAIKAGVVREGMPKAAVIMSYGYPPEHRTPSLANSTWVYWMSKRRTKNICFDQNERAIRCGGQPGVSNTL